MIDRSKSSSHGTDASRLNYDLSSLTSKPSIFANPPPLDNYNMLSAGINWSVS